MVTKNKLKSLFRYEEKTNNILLDVISGTKKGYETARGLRIDTVRLSYPGSKTRRGRVGKEMANTLDTQCNQGIIDTIYYPKGECEIAVRRLTPKECFRLQGFPDEYFEKAELVNSDSQLYKQAGNSVTVPVIQAIAERLK